MSRTARYQDWEVALARELVASARSPQQLRQGLAILIPVLTGASIEQTATLLGIRKSCVCALRRKLRVAGRAVLAAREERGGRRRELMSRAQETQFLAPLRQAAAQQGGIPLAVVHAALERSVGKPVPRSTVYRLLVRQGWQTAATRPATWRAVAG
jgi:transposase